MPLFSLWQPSVEQVARVCQESTRAKLNYPGVGSTLDADKTTLALPSSKHGILWSKDNIRVQIGSGQKTYERAKTLLQRWQQFQLGWTYVPSQTPVKEGSAVAVVAQTIVLWIVNPLRITYVHEHGPERQQTASHNITRSARRHMRRLEGGQSSSDHSDVSSSAEPSNQVSRWQFAHGCVQGHLLAGEEAFRVDWNHADDTVWYEVLTFSRPDHPLAYAAFPILRFFQAKFARDSVKALQTALEQDDDEHGKTTSSSSAAAHSKNRAVAALTWTPLKL